MSKKLIINADDYGLCPDVNQAIEDLIVTGQLRDVSVLTNFDSFEQAAAFLSQHPECSIGVHLNIVEGIPVSPFNKVRSLLGSYSRFTDLREILKRWILSPFLVSREVEIEWRAQIESLLETGLKISHADSHQHIHAFPPFWKILVNLCREYKIPAIRLPRERNKIQMRRAPAFALRQATNLSRTFFPNRGIAVNQHFLGFKRAGTYGENEMIDDLQNLKSGITELIIHPSLSDGNPYPELRGMLEYEALSGSKVWRQIAESEIEITTWAEFAKIENSRIN